MMRTHTEVQVATSIYDSEQCDALSDVKEGVKVQVVATPSEGHGSPVWKTVDTFETIDTVSVGSTCLATGPIEMVKRLRCPLHGMDRSYRYMELPVFHIVFP